MTKKLKIKVDFDGKNTKALLDFITETQEGKYTDEKPDLKQITYKRLDIQEKDFSQLTEESEVLLFGIS